jgi:hypothetical protein
MRRLVGYQRLRDADGQGVFYHQYVFANAQGRPWFWRDVTIGRTVYRLPTDAEGTPLDLTGVAVAYNQLKTALEVLPRVDPPRGAGGRFATNPMEQPLRGLQVDTPPSPPAPGAGGVRAAQGRGSLGRGDGGQDPSRRDRRGARK